MNTVIHVSEADRSYKMDAESALSFLAGFTREEPAKISVKMLDGTAHVSITTIPKQNRCTTCSERFFCEGWVSWGVFNSCERM